MSAKGKEIVSLKEKMYLEDGGIGEGVGGAICKKLNYWYV